MVELENGTHVVVHRFFVIGSDKERQPGTGRTGSRFDDVRHVTLVVRLIEVLDASAAVLGMLFQVEVATVGDPLELTPAPREHKLDVGGARRIMRQLVFIMIAHHQQRFRNTQVDVPLVTLVTPVLVPLLGLVGRNEELHLHLFELAGAEDKVAGCDLVAEALTDLGDTERRLLTGCLLHVHEVGEHALSCFGAQEDLVARTLDRTSMGLEHKVELFGLGERVLVLAVRADVGVFELVDTKAFVAFAAFDEWIAEVRQMTRGFEHGRWTNDCCVETYDIVAQLHHRAPPEVLNVAKQQNADRAVVVGGTASAIDVSRLEGEAAALRQVDNLFHQVAFNKRRYVLRHEDRGYSPQLTKLGTFLAGEACLP